VPPEQVVAVDAPRSPARPEQRTPLDGDVAPVPEAGVPEARRANASFPVQRVELEVRVSSEAGLGMAGVAVRAMTRSFVPDGVGLEREGRTDAAGVARLDVRPGRVFVYAYTEEDPVATASDDVLCIGAGPFSTGLTLTRSAVVRGRVYDDSSGTGIPGARVSGPDDRRHGIAPTRTDDRGEFELAGWPVDVVAGLMVTAAGYGMEQVKLAVTRDGTWEIPARFGWEKRAGSGGIPWVEVGLVPEKVIFGSVVDRSGAPVTNATLEATGRFLTMARMAHRDRASAAVSDGGGFELDGLRSDITHSIRVRAPGFLDESAVSRPTVLTDLGEVVLEPVYFVEGVVVDREGQALPGLRVECVSVEKQVPHPSWDPEDGTRLDRDGFSGHFPIASSGYTSEAGRFRIEGGSTPELELRVGFPRRALHEQTLRRPSAGNLDCGQIVLEEGVSIVSFRVPDLPPGGGGVGGRLEATLALPGAEDRVFSRVPCSPDGDVVVSWPVGERLVDVIIVDTESGRVLLERRGQSLEQLQAD
jgi:hypothetical protein